MTKEEIEQLVDQKMATAVAQIGKDLEDRYATTVSVKQLLDEYSKAQADGLRKVVGELNGLNADMDQDHPGFWLMDQLAEVNQSLLELRLLVLLDRKKGMVGGDMQKTMLLVRTAQALAGVMKSKVLETMKRGKELAIKARLGEGRDPKEEAQLDTLMDEVLQMLGE